jgi:hypothetical protein
MKIVFCRLALTIVFIAMAVPTLAADPQYPAGVDSITAAIAGTVSATRQNIDLGRSSDRLKIIRTELTRALASNFSKNGTFKVSLNAQNVLCKPRVAHAVLASQRSYASAVTAQLQTTATPGNITTLLDAIGVIFHHYSIDVVYSDVKTRERLTAEVTKNCAADANAFGNAYYGIDGLAPIADEQRDQTVDEPLIASEPRPGADIALISAFSALIEAINAIVNPIAKAADLQARQEAIRVFLLTWPVRLTTVATNLAQEGTSLANRRKLQAAGQFSGLLASISLEDVELSKIGACKNITAEDKAFGEPVDDPNTSGKKIQVPSVRFQACYLEIWQALSDRVAAALKAADDYDQFADASSSKVVETAKKIKVNIQQLQPNNPQPDLKTLWEDALKLVAFGKMLQDALSKAHQDDLKSAIQSLVKAF